MSKWLSGAQFPLGSNHNMFKVPFQTKLFYDLMINYIQEAVPEKELTAMCPTLQCL